MLNREFILVFILYGYTKETLVTKTDKTDTSASGTITQGRSQSVLDAARVPSKGN